MQPSMLRRRPIAHPTRHEGFGLPMRFMRAAGLSEQYSLSIPKLKSADATYVKSFWVRALPDSAFAKLTHVLAPNRLNRCPVGQRQTTQCSQTKGP